MNTSGSIDALVLLQVDDRISAEFESFLQDEDDASREFKSHGQIYVSSGQLPKFNGQELTSRSGDVYAHQTSHILRIPMNPMAHSPELFISHGGQAAYLSTCTTSDVAFVVNQLSQVNPEDAVEVVFKKLYKVFKQLREDAVEFRFANVELQKTEVHFSSNASFANNKEISPQKGHIILFVDSKKNYSITTWSPSKCKRVMRSVLAPELYAADHAYDAKFSITHTLNNLVGRKFTMRLFTNSRRLFDPIESSADRHLLSASSIQG